MIKKHSDIILTCLRVNQYIDVKGYKLKIPPVKAAARGFGDFKNYRLSLLFYPDARKTPPLQGGDR